MTDDHAVLTPEGFAALLDALRADGFALVGPTVRDGAITYDTIEGASDLPAGWTEVQEPGRYRLERRDDGALFGFASGSHSFKRTFFAPQVTLLRAKRKDGSFVVLDPPSAPPKPVALIGARACDLNAIAIQDRVFLQGSSTDASYAARRRGTFVVALQCGTAGGTCFCVSMNAGPEVTSGFDLALTELLGAEHRFVVQVGSPEGRALLARVPYEPAEPADLAAAAEVPQRTRAAMGRTLDTTNIAGLLAETLDHPRWDEVATRCLACTSCTLACPTCFCSTIEDTTDLTGQEASRVQRWDSCFTLEHSYVHGGSVRASTKARFRQFVTHKLGTWIEQFGSSGCVGCGRCVTWCPVGIDLTEEVAALRGAPTRDAAADQSRALGAEEV